MSANITFTCQTLRGTNKAGLLKPDANGYYTVVLGGFNIRNEMGNFYPFNKYLEQAFQNSSSFMRRITRGRLWGECNHPKPWPGMTQDQWFSRLRELVPDRFSHHIAGVTLDFDNFKSQHGETMVAVLGRIRPVNSAFGNQLKGSLDNPEEDTCFSVRSLTLDTNMGMAWQKDIYELATWDWIPEGGVRNASKYYSPGLESFQEWKFDAQTVQNVLYSAKNGNTGMGLEAIEGETASLEAILGAIGFDGGNAKSTALRW